MRRKAFNCNGGLFLVVEDKDEHLFIGGATIDTVPGELKMQRKSYLAVWILAGVSIAGIVAGILIAGLWR